MFADGGLPAGASYGASDARAAYPARDPVTPQDVAATIYKAMGLDPESMIRDPLDRPHALSLGTTIGALLGG